MQLTPEQVAGFQAIYRAKFGQEISREQAYEQGVKLLRLMEIIYHPMTQAEFNKVREREDNLTNS